MGMQETKHIFKKTWNFLWKDDSLLSWVISLILAFLIVKFIFYPALSLIFMSQMPLVVVESHSMVHPGSVVKTLTGVPLFAQDKFSTWWDENKDWYESNGINTQETSSWRFSSGMDKGDIILLYGSKNLKVGDVIVFNAHSSSQRYPVIHRIVKIYDENGQKIYETKGDNNSGQIDFEKNILQDEIIGKALIKIPKIGWIKLIFVEILRLFFPNL